MLQPAQIPVGTTAARLTAPGPGARNGSSIAVQAPAAATLWVGDASVTPSTGWPVAAGQTMTLDLEYGEAVYGILASGSGTAYVLRTGL